MVLVPLLFLVLLLAVRATTWALSDYSRSRLERYTSTRQPAVLGRIFNHDDDALLALRALTWCLLGAIAATTPLWLLGSAQAADLPASSYVRGGAILALAALLLDFVIARPFGRALAEPILYWSWSVIQVFIFALFPLIKILRVWDRAVHRLAGRPDEGRPSPIQEEILSVVNEGEREGAILGDAADMIEGLMELHEAIVADIMTPRTDMVMLKGDDTLEEARQAITHHGHSRIPVHGENRDEILGVLYAKDLLPAITSPEEAARPLSTLPLRRPVYVPETKPVNVLLREFQRGRVHIAIVLDEYGGVAGLVTIEDILEEIVGEIADEHDPDEPPAIERIDEKTLLVDGRVHLDEINEWLPVRLPEDEEFDTVGGYLFSTLGRIPKVGEQFTLNHALFTIIDAGDRAIHRVKVELTPAARTADESSADA